MTSQAIPQTRTVMEAGFTLREGIEEQFWRANNAAVPTAASQPGFVAVTGGPIANSSWLYFSGTWETPDTMGQWYWSRRHKPMQDAAFSKWFAKMYIRKWRLPADGEALGQRIFCQTSIRRPDPLDDARVADLAGSLAAALGELGASAFETLSGELEPQPVQLVDGYPFAFALRAQLADFLRCVARSRILCRPPQRRATSPLPRSRFRG